MKCKSNVGKRSQIIIQKYYSDTINILFSKLRPWSGKHEFKIFLKS